MYVILTSKPGLYRTDMAEGMSVADCYDYLYAGRHIATFVIASLTEETRVTIVEEAVPPLVNHVPTRFLDKFATLSAAQAALRALTEGGASHARLIRHDAAPASQHDNKPGFHP